MEEMNEALVGVENNQERKVPKYLVYDWSLNVKTQEFRCDPAAQNLFFGETFSVIPSSKLIDLIPKKQRLRVKSIFHEVLSAGEERYFHCCFLSPKCVFIYVEVNVYRTGEHELKGTLSPCLSVSSAHEAAEIFYSVFENPHHGILITDSNTRILACNQHFEAMSGYLRNEMFGLKTNIFNSATHDEDYYKDLWGNLKRNGYWSGVVLSRDAKGSIFPQNLTIQSISPNEEDEYYIGFGTDLSSNLGLLEDVESGGVDLLTQLPTAESFLFELKQKCTQVNRHSTVLVAAIKPKFSFSNLLEQKRQFARYLKEHTNVLCCGYMPNEQFLVCFPVSFEHPKQRVRDVAKTLTMLFQSFKAAPSDIYEALKASFIGISIYGVDAESPNSLISHACQAMLELHSSEQRKISFYDRSIHRQIERKKRLEAHFRECLKQGNVSVYFQPLLSATTQQVEKFEALCRLPELEGEDVSSEEYISIAEDLNLIVQLDDLVCRLAFRQFNRLKNVFGDHIGLCVNRSFHTDLAVYDVIQQVAIIIDDEGMDAEKLTLEFTEIAHLESDQESMRIIQFLRDSGVTIAVDEFGTGSSSFQHLKEKFFDELKIDRVFISGVEMGTREYSIVKALIRLAKKLDLSVIAEGVETISEFNMVMSLGVDYIQGHLLAKPENLESILTNEQYCQWPENTAQPTSQSVAMLANKHSSHLDPSDPLSLVYQYFQDGTADYIPVVDGKKCVGVIDREHLNLHMTPNMGTDLESSKERGMWNKTANRMLSPIHTTLDWSTDTSEIEQLLSEEAAFPWVLVDDHGHYKGLIEMKSVLNYLVSGDR